MNTSILYLSNPGIAPLIKKTCLYYLEKVDLPIVKMEQDPEWEICGLSMYKQILNGLEQIKTDYVAIAEHDCVYTPEHFYFTVPDDRYFYYNQNNWLLQYDNPNFPEMNGTFSYWPKRRVQSQLICRVDMLREATEVNKSIVEDPLWREVREHNGIGEPGTVGEKALRLTSKSRYKSLRRRIKDYLIGYQARDFLTEIPNIDIRHATNFTGPRRGIKRTQTLDPRGIWMT